jgi:Sigma-70, region 4
MLVLTPPRTERLVLHDVAVLPDRLVLRLENGGSLELTLKVTVPDTAITSGQGRSVGRRTGSRNADRDQQIVEAFEQGATLDAIGQRFDLTRERVRQIVTRAGAKRRYRNVFDRFVSDHGTAIDEAFDTLRHPAAVAGQLGLPESKVRSYLLEREGETLPLRATRRRQYSDDQLVEALRKAGGEIGQLSAKKYGEWRNARAAAGERVPSQVLSFSDLVAGGEHCRRQMSSRDVPLDARTGGVGIRRVASRPFGPSSLDAQS